MNPGGGACSEPRLQHCTPAWVTEQHSILGKKKKDVHVSWFTAKSQNTARQEKAYSFKTTYIEASKLTSPLRTPGPTSSTLLLTNSD